MSVDKLVDSTQLDSDLTSVANAIRTKGGTSAGLAFPSDFVQAIADIPTGGSGFSVTDVLEDKKPDGVVQFKPSKNVPAYGIAGRGMTQLTVDLTDGYKLMGYAITRNESLARLVILSDYTAAQTQHNSYAITANNAMTQIIMRGRANSFDQSGMRANTALEILDVEYMTHPNGVGTFISSMFYGNTNMNILILRQTDAVPSLANTGAFSGTKFASGKAGGTLYVPNTMIASYQAASNWSTILGYETNSIVKLEGSPYESLDWWKS